MKITSDKNTVKINIECTPKEAKIITDILKPIRDKMQQRLGETHPADTALLEATRCVEQVHAAFTVKE